MHIDPKQLIALISDKKAILKKIIEIIDRNHKQKEGCAKMRESISRREDPNHSQLNLIRCTEIALQVSEKNSQDLMELAQLLLVYTQSDNFTSDVAKMAMKLGAGEEALQAMFKEKMR
jgi:hypothetical protein